MWRDVHTRRTSHDALVDHDIDDDPGIDHPADHGDTYDRDIFHVDLHHDSTAATYLHVGDRSTGHSHADPHDRQQLA